MATRAKFICNSVTKRTAAGLWDSRKQKTVDQGFVFDAQLYPVTSGSPENDRFYASTPAGQIQISTIREDHFVPGKTYYVDFVEAE